MKESEVAVFEGVAEIAISGFAECAVPKRAEDVAFKLAEGAISEGAGGMVVSSAEQDWSDVFLRLPDLDDSSWSISTQPGTGTPMEPVGQD